MSLALLLAVLLVATSFEVSAEEPATDSDATTPIESTESSDEDAAPVSLDEVVVTGAKPSESPVSGTRIGEPELASRRASATDTARLLEDVPGVSLYGGGGISSQPAIHGLADDRLRVQVDGMDVTSACSNHMNSPLSYISPSQVRSVTVFAGLTPVSVGGNSVGGTIQVESAPPEFASAPDEVLTRGHLGGFVRSNGNGIGYDVAAAVAGRDLRVSYSESTARSDDYFAGDSFKAAGQAAPLRGWLDGDEVGSSAWDGTTNRDVGLAFRREGHLLQLNLGRQNVGFEGFPNQRMDLTSNENTLGNLRYTGQFDWGALQVRLFDQDTRHEMDMGPDRFFYGFGMPMDSEATNRGANVKASIELSDRHVLGVGSEYLTYRLDDWWSPVGASGSMCCEKFWNVRDGEQSRLGAYAEWEARWSPTWLSLVGVRWDLVSSDAGDVQGYNDSMSIWSNDAAAFNARDHRRSDSHVDLVALLRWVPHEMATIEGGYARKTRSPNLYERYAWSTNAMAALMNNFVGDGNGYIGRIDLEPEVAHTLSASGELHDADQSAWSVKATLYATRINDFIDARRCDFGQCSAANSTAIDSFVFLQYANQSAWLHGVDLSGHWLLGRSDRFGGITARGSLSYVRGRNRKTDDDLYNIMPLNGKLALVHDLGGWTSAVEFSAVASKTRVSSVRNEVQTGNYSLVDLRTSYTFAHARVDLSHREPLRPLLLGASGGRLPRTGTLDVYVHHPLGNPGSRRGTVGERRTEPRLLSARRAALRIRAPSSIRAFGVEPVLPFESGSRPWRDLRRRSRRSASATSPRARSRPAPRRARVRPRGAWRSASRSQGRGRRRPRRFRDRGRSDREPARAPRPEFPGPGRGLAARPATGCVRSRFSPRFLRFRSGARCRQGCESTRAGEARRRAP